MDRCLHFAGDVTPEWPVGRVVSGLTGPLVVTGAEYADGRTTVRFRRGTDEQHGLAVAAAAATGRRVRVEP